MNRTAPLSTFSLAIFSICIASAFGCGDDASSTGGKIQVTISGESAATEGVPFPGDLYFRDGWEVKYDHVLVTVGNINLSDNPDKSSTDQSQTGSIVAMDDGIYAVDLAKPGTGAVDAKEGNGKAIPLFTFENQNKVSGKPEFSLTDRYAFGFELLPASNGARAVNLDAEAQAAYEAMKANGWSVWLKGTATFKGDSASPACRTSASYDFDRLPTVVNFSFGFKAPVEFKNCINPELNDLKGVQAKANDTVVSQITFHLDHPFWESLVEDAPLRWDAIAARKSVASGTAPAATVTEADLATIDFVSIKDAQNNALKTRYCGPLARAETPEAQLSYVADNLDAGFRLDNLLHYATYNLSTMGHLNNDGLCYPARKFTLP